MIHSLRAVIISKSGKGDGTVKVDPVKTLLLNQNRQIPLLPLLIRDECKFWANLLEGADEIFLDEQYLKHGINGRVVGRHQYFTQGLLLGRNIVEPGKDLELIKNLRVEGNLVPGREYRCTKLITVLKRIYGRSAFVDIKDLNKSICYLNGISRLYNLKFERLDVKRSTKQVPRRLLLEDFSVLA